METTETKQPKREGISKIPEVVNFIVIRGHYILFDESDAELVASRRWQINGGYVSHHYRKNTIYRAISMHRLMLSPPAGMHVDHINGDGLDNRRCNLRLCLPSDNCKNRSINTNNKSGFKGVYFSNSERKYKSQIMVMRKRINLGTFENAESAAHAYDDAARIHHGEFARLNFPGSANA